jgi:predicted CXXCH cytochrome family protein
VLSRLYSKLYILAISHLTKDAIEVILKHLTDRLALAALFLPLILLVATLVPNPVGNWARSNPMYIAFGILGPLCYLPTRWLLEKFSESQEAGKRHKRLDNLTPREQQILGPYIRGDYRTRNLPHTDAVAKGLADDGVLHQPVKTEGCESCHSPHGSPNPHLLKTSNLNVFCLKCHTGSTFSAASGTPDFHNQAAQFQACTLCHVAIHGSNFDRHFLK